MLASLAQLFRSPRSRRAAAVRRRPVREPGAGLAMQQLEQRLALAFTADTVTIKTTPSAESALIITIDDVVDANGEGREIYLQHATDGNPFFLIATNPSFTNATRVSASTNAGSVSTILVTSSSQSSTVPNAFFSSTYAVGFAPPAPGNTTSGNFAHSFTFQSSTLIPTQRLIVDLAPAGSSIAINSRWDARRGDNAGIPGIDADLTVYQGYGGYLTAGQIALYATNVTVSSDVTFRNDTPVPPTVSRFTADGFNQPGSANQRRSLFTEPVRNLTVGANIGISPAGTVGGDIRVRLEGTTTNPGLLQVSPAATMSATNTLALTSLGADFQVEGVISSPTQTYVFNSVDVAGTPFPADPNTYTFTTRSKATGVQSGRIVAGSIINMTLGNAAGGTVDVRTDAARLGFTSGVTGEGVPYRYAINVEETNDLVISSVASSSGPISITTGSPGTTGNDLTIQGTAVQTAGDLSLTTFGAIALGGTLSSSNGTVRVQADSLALSSGVTAGGGKNVTLFTNTGDAAVNGLSRAGGLVLRSVRVASTANLPALVGLLTVDGTALVAGDRVLVKNQTNSAQNGIYVAQAGVWQRAGDNDEAAEFTPGFLVHAVEGTQRGGWVFTNPVLPVFSGAGVNQTGLTFLPVTAASSYANVQAATTANLPALAGLLTVDGVGLVAGDRVLVKNQSNAAQNGIYVAQAGAWRRAGDANSPATLVAGGYVFVTGGGQSGTGWVLTNDAVSVGTTLLSFTLFTQQPPTAAAFWAPVNVLRDADVATTVNIALSGLQSIDGVLLTGGERVLVKNQIDPAANGVYVAASGAWARDADANTAAELPRGTTVYVLSGTQGRGTSWTFDDSVRRMGTTTANSTTLSGLGTTAGLTAGMLVVGEGIPANTTIASIIDATSVRLSTVATLSRATSPVTFTPLLDTVLGTTPLTFLPTAGDVNIAAARSISGSSRLQGAAALLQAGAVAGATAANSSINARTNVGTLTAAAPGAITLDNSSPVELASVSTTTAGPITVTADGTVTATRVTAKAVAGTPGNVSLTSVFGDVVARSITSDLGTVTLNSINGSVELPAGGSVLTTGSVAVTADNGVVGIRGRIAAQGTGSDISLSSANGMIDVPATADISAQDQVRIFAGDPTKPTSVLTSKFTGTRLDWTAAGPLPSQSTNFRSLKATRTDDGPLVVTAAAAGTFTIEGLNTRNGAISVTASDLAVTGAIFTGDSSTPGFDDDVTLTATAGKIILDGSVNASRDVVLSATDTIGYSVGTLATATATVAGGQVTGLTLTAPGAGYTAPPAVVVSPPQQPGGTRAVYAALVNPAGQVTGFQQIVAGSGYTAPPTVTIAPPAVISARNAMRFTANNAARLNTATKSLSGTLTGTNATLVVTEADDLALGTVQLPGGGTAAITTGSGTTIGNLSVDSLDAGAAGDVRIDAFGNVLGVLPAPDIVAGKASILATGGRIDLATSITGPVSAAATLDVVLANSTDLVVNNLASSNGGIALKSQGGVTQVAGGRIVATSGNGLLDVIAKGDVLLANVGNDVNSLAVNSGTAKVSFQDANDFAIGGTGVVAGAVTLASAGGSITQTAPVVTQGLVVNSPAGAVVLTNAANNVATVAVQAAGQTVKFVDADDFTVAAPGIAGGDVTLSTVAFGATVAQTAAINAASVTLTGVGGNFLLDTQPNQTGSFSSDAGPSVIRFLDSAGNLAVGQVTGAGGDVTLTAAGPVTQTGAITTGAFKITGNGGPIQLNTIANDVKTFSAVNGGGIVSFYDALGGLELAGVTGSSVAFTVIGGDLTQSAPVTATVLQVASFGGAAVALDSQNNLLDVFAAYASGPVSVKDTAGDLVLAGIDGYDGIPTKLSVEVAGGLYESLPIKAGAVVVKGSGSPIVLDSQKNEVGSFAATNGSGWVSFRDSAGGLDVAGITGGPVTLFAAGPVTQSAAITAASLSVTGTGGLVQLNTQPNAIGSFTAVNPGGGVLVYDSVGDLVLGGATAGYMDVVGSGSITQTAPLSLDTLGISGYGPNVTLDNPANLVNTLAGANIGGNVTFVNAGNLNAGPITAGTAGAANGNVSLTALAGNINVIGSLTAEQDQILLDAPNGTIIFATGVALNGDILVYYTDPNQPAPTLPGTVPPVVAQNGNLSITNPAADNFVLVNGYSATGDIKIESDAGFTLSGLLRTTGVGKSVTLTAKSGSIAFVGAGGIDNAPSLGGTTVVEAAAGTVSGGATNAISGGTTTLKAGQGITLPGAIAANTLAADGSGSAVTLAGSNRIGTFTTKNAGGAVTLSDTEGGLVVGAVDAASLTVTAAGPVTQTAAIKAESVTVTGKGSEIALNTQPNTFGTFAATNGGGTVSVWTTAPSLALGAVTVGSLVVTASGPVTQTAPLSAGGLVVSGAGGGITLDNKQNVVGGIVVNNPGGGFTLQTTTGLVLAGVNAASVTLAAAGVVSQSAPVTATSLAVTGNGSAVTLDTQANVLGSFSATNGAGAVSVRDAKGDLSLGAIQGGPVTVTAAGAVSQTAAITAATLAVTGVGSPINLGTQANVIDTFAATNGNGAVTIRDSAGALNLGNIASGALTVNAAGNVAVNQTRVVASGPATITTTGGGTLTVTGPQTGGLVSSSGVLSLAGVQGTIALVSGGLVQGQSITGNKLPIQVGGTIATTAELNSAVGQINKLPVIAGSPYEIVVGANLTLTQTLSFTRAVSLRGASAAARLTGSAAVTNGVVLGSTAGGSRITNLAFAGFAGTALQLNGVQNAAVSGVTVTGTGGTSTGIGFSGVSNGTTVRGSSFSSLGTGASIVGATGLTFGGTATGQGNTITSAARAGVFASGVCTGSSVVKTRFVSTPQPYNVGGSRGLSIVN